MRIIAGGRSVKSCLPGNGSSRVSGDGELPERVGGTRLETDLGTSMDPPDDVLRLVDDVEGPLLGNEGAICVLIERGYGPVPERFLLEAAGLLRVDD